MKQPNSNRKIYEFEKLSEKFYIHIVRDGACQVFFFGGLVEVKKSFAFFVCFIINNAAIIRCCR